ncbi:MAG: 3-oxoacyl-ACP reductase FabG [Anaeroplasma sp.]
MKVALVTGASRGIGRACAVRLAKDGFTVVINYSSNEAKASEVLEEIKAFGGTGMIYKADVSKLPEVRNMVRDVYKEYGQIDVLVNNAGIVRDEYLLTMKEENLDSCLNLNVKGYFYCAQQVGLKMFRKKSGVIINMSSVSGKFALPGQTVYGATKGAVNTFTQTLAKEMAPYGIRVNAVAPGFIATEMIDALSDEVKEEYLKNIPAKRFGKAEEVAAVVSMLASDELSYMTGQVLTIDGGISL